MSRPCPASRTCRGCSRGDHFRRADLAHAAGSTIRATFRTETGRHAFLDLVLAYPGATSTVTLFLRARGYRPSGAPEFVPSSLYFDIDQERAVAGATFPPAAIDWPMTQDEVGWIAGAGY